MRLFLLPILLISTACLAQDWKSINDLGMSHYRAGDYLQAEHLFRQALEIAKAKGGSASDEFITSITNLGYTEQKQSNVEKAQAYFRVAFRHTRRHNVTKIDHVEAAINLANSFLPSGQYDSCEYYLSHAQQLVARVMKEKTSDYTTKVHQYFDASISIQNSLASLCYQKGLLSDAIAIMVRQRLDIQQAYPTEWAAMSTYKSTLNNLSNYYLAANEIEKAKEVINEQVDLASRKPVDVLDYLYALNNLASTHRLSDEPEAAAVTWERALAIIDSAGYRGSDLHISILNNLGEMYSAFEDYDKGRSYLRQSLEVQEKRPALHPRIYQTTLLNLCETDFWSGDLQKADGNYRKLVDMLVDEVLYNFTYLSDREKISFYRNNLSILESYKFFAFNASGVFRSKPDPNAYVSKDVMKDLLNVLLTTKGLILNPGYRLRTAILASADPEIRTRYEEWINGKNEYASLAKSESPPAERLSYLKHSNESLEKWLRLHSPEFRKGFVMERKTWQDIQKALSPTEAAIEMVRLADGLVYGALILTSETKDGPVVALVKSIETRFLDQHYYQQYANAIAFGLADTLSYGVYWEPILQAIQKHEKPGTSIQTVYLSADGIYNRINPNTLFNPITKKYLIDELTVRHVTNLKEIVSDAPTKNKGLQHAVIAGRPLYHESTTNRGAVISDLAGTEREVDAINDLLTSHGWRTTVVKHSAAREGVIKLVQSPDVLHLATHGFSAHKAQQNSDPVDVLLNSGVMLAGAGDKAPSDGEDGILTAYEMMNMNLDSTRLVVLSACETGLGAYHTGEGIYGLQAAIRSAGARSVIMSLWKVDDAATQALMTSFYRHWITHPGDMRLAFQKAQRELRTTFPSPYYWGAFVLSGD